MEETGVDDTARRSSLYTLYTVFRQIRATYVFLSTDVSAIRSGPDSEEKKLGLVYE